MTRASLIAVLLLIVPTLAAAGDDVRKPAQALDQQPAVSVHEAMVVVEASCASLCRQRHNQCRISTRGAPRCDADLQRCLKGCLATKRR